MLLGLVLAVVTGVDAGADLVEDPRATPVAEPPPPFGRVVYRATKVGSFESLGVLVIRCRQKDGVPRRLQVDVFTTSGRPVPFFGTNRIDPWPSGAATTIVGDGRYYQNRPDVRSMRLGHLTAGTARVVSDARMIRCQGRMRFDGGWGLRTKWDGIGFAREGREPQAPTW